MNTNKVTKLLTRMQSTALGLEGMLWTSTYYAKDKAYLSKKTEGIQIQLENLQADLDELKREVQL
jgi:hypothetical protein